VNTSRAYVAAEAPHLDVLKVKRLYHDQSGGAEDQSAEGTSSLGGCSSAGVCRDCWGGGSWHSGDGAEDNAGADRRSRGSWDSGVTGAGDGGGDRDDLGGDGDDRLGLDVAGSNGAAERHRDVVCDGLVAGRCADRVGCVDGSLDLTIADLCNDALADSADDWDGNGADDGALGGADDDSGGGNDDGGRAGDGAEDGAAANADADGAGEGGDRGLDLAVADLGDDLYALCRCDGRDCKDGCEVLHFGCGGLFWW